MTIADRTQKPERAIPTRLLCMLAVAAVCFMASTPCVADVKIADRWVAFGPLEKSQATLDAQTLARIPKQLEVAGKTLDRHLITAYDGVAALDDATGRVPGTAAYVFMPIRSDADREFELGLGADHWMTAYLNGEEVASTWETGGKFFYGTPWPPHRGNMSVTVQLKRGLNVLAFRFARGNASTLLAVGEAVDHHGTTWVVDNPLYEELIEHREHPIGSTAAIFNYRQRMVERIGGINPAMDALGLMYGLPATREMYRADAARHRMHPMTHVNYYLQETFRPFGGDQLEWVDETGVGLNVARDFTYLEGHGIGLYRNQKAYLDALERHGDRLWGLWLGDEQVWYNTSKALAALTGDYSENYLRPRHRGFFRKARRAGSLDRAALDAERARIKEEYGFGKFDLPSSLESTGEPFRWIAFNRWFFDEMLVGQKQLWEVAEESERRFGYRPWVLSNDARGEATPHFSSRFGEYADILMAQTHAGKHGRWAQPATFAAKLRADLSGKNVWPCVHIDTHGGIETAEEANEQLSQVLRGGGNGFLYWDRDIAGRGRGYNDSGVDYYGHPGRFRVFTNAVDRARGIGALKQPEPDFAMFVSNDTAMSRFSNAMQSNTMAIFNYFGPIAGTWFTYISDAQIEDGKVDPREWDTIFLADCEFQRREVSEAVFDAVMSGGKTVVSLQGEVFTHHIDGTPTPKYMKEMFGVTVEGPRPASEVIIRRPLSLLPGTPAGTRLPMNQRMNAASRITVEPGVTVLATFEDGEPAMTVKPLPGGGKAIYCAFTWNHRNAVVTPWRDLARSFATGLGFELDHDIWRFQFPMPEEAKQPPSYDNGEPVALTGNNFHWWENRALVYGNADDAGGRYRYSVAPTAPGEEHTDAGEWHGFDIGDLTDRTDAHTGPNFVSPHGETLRKVRSGELSIDMYLVGWDTPEEVEIEVDLGRQAVVTEAELVYKGAMRGYRVLGSLDGDSFQPLGEHGSHVSDDVPAAKVATATTPVRYVKIVLNERQPGELLRVAELTLRGHPQ